MINEKARLQINLARLKKQGENFEVDVDPDLAIRYKKGEAVDIRDVLKAERIFKDTQKGLAASQAKMKEILGTDDALEAAAVIIKQGDIQVSSEYRAGLREAKRKRIINIIQMYGIDPRTKLPHPPQRIEAAIEQSKVRIDEYKSAEEQIDDIVKKLQPVLPISLAKKQIWVKVPMQYAAKSQSAVRSFARIVKEEWRNDGSWEVTVEIPGGLENEFYDKLNKVTKGEAETKGV